MTDLCLNSLHNDLLFKILSYLSLNDLKKIPSISKKYYDLCYDVSPRVSGYWKGRVSSVYRHVLKGEAYQDFNIPSKITKINKHFHGQDTYKYNYHVYVCLIRMLDPLSQGLTYFNMGDMETFNSLPDQIKYFSYYLTIGPNYDTRIRKTELKEIKIRKTDPESQRGEMMKKQKERYKEEMKTLYAKNSDRWLSEFHTDIMKFDLDRMDQLTHLAQNISRKGYFILFRFFWSHKKEKLNYDPSRYMSDAGSCGSLDMVQYLVRNNNPSLHDAIGPAAINNHTEILKYCRHKSSSHIYKGAIRGAINENSYEAFKLLYSWRESHFRELNDEIIGIAVESNRIKIIEYMIIYENYPIDRITLRYDLYNQPLVDLIRARSEEYRNNRDLVEAFRQTRLKDVIKALGRGADIRKITDQMLRNAAEENHMDLVKLAIKEMVLRGLV